MIEFDFEIPKPSKFVSFEVVDSIALQVNQAYRAENKNGYPIDGEELIDWLDLSTEWDYFDEPEGVSFFAGLTPERGSVYLNETHKEFFDERPDVFRICIGHEAGHAILRHLIQLSGDQQPTLFSQENEDTNLMLHRSSWYQYGLSKEEVENRKSFEKNLKEKLVRQSLVNSEARLELKQLDEKFEPKWMFLQAEHFAKCICIPKDKLAQMLETIPLTNSWRPIYELAKNFGVSASVMKSRLKQLDVIKIENDRPNPISGGQRFLLG